MSEDEHIIEVAKAKVVIKNGKVIEVGKPLVTHCPLRHEFYGGTKETQESIRESVELKIEEFGFFTENRVLEYEGRDVPFGASEMLRDAMHEGLIDQRHKYRFYKGIELMGDVDLAEYELADAGIKLESYCEQPEIMEYIFERFERECLK